MRTKSRHSGESPAILPSAQTACKRENKLQRERVLRHKERVTCSLTSSFGLMRSCTKMGTAPFAMTTRVCSDVPDAMFVNAHALSNCSIGLSPICAKELQSTERRKRGEMLLNE